MVIDQHSGSQTARMFRRLGVVLVSLAVFAGPLPAADVDVPEVIVVPVSPERGSAEGLVPDWEQPRRPSTLSGNDRQAILKQVSGGGSGGVPLLNSIQTQGRTPTVRHLILTVKRPWYVHRGFLSGENVQRVDARSTMRFHESTPGRAIVGLNLIEGNIYLVDFLIDGEGQGDYSVETSAGSHAFPDPDGERTHVLLALKAERNGWTEVSLRRDAGAFNLHSVEITLAQGPPEEEG